ncbi:MAG: hypothetical protein DIU62_000750 [Pseudomonadota bacterium]|jgi:soluble cytochrome b562
MRRRWWHALLLVLAADMVVAAGPELDKEVMETIEVVNESLASNIGLRDVAAVHTDAKDLDELFAEVEAYFTARGDAKDAVDYTRRTRLLLGTVKESVDAGRFEDAANAASEVGRVCKACHRKYKP